MLQKKKIHGGADGVVGDDTNRTMKKFLDPKELIQDENIKQLYELVKKIPKGVMLHSHLGAEVNMSNFIKTITNDLTNDLKEKIYYAYDFDKIYNFYKELNKFIKFCKSRLSVNGEISEKRYTPLYGTNSYLNDSTLISNVKTNSIDFIFCNLPFNFSDVNGPYKVVNGGLAYFTDGPPCEGFYNLNELLNLDDTMFNDILINKGIPINKNYNIKFLDILDINYNSKNLRKNQIYELINYATRLQTEYDYEWPSLETITHAFGGFIKTGTPINKTDNVINCDDIDNNIFYQYLVYLLLNEYNQNQIYGIELKSNIGKYTVKNMIIKTGQYAIYNGVTSKNETPENFISEYYIMQKAIDDIINTNIGESIRLNTSISLRKQHNIYCSIIIGHYRFEDASKFEQKCLSAKSYNDTHHNPLQKLISGIDIIAGETCPGKSCALNNNFIDVFKKYNEFGFSIHTGETYNEKFDPTKKSRQNIKSILQLKYSLVNKNKIIRVGHGLTLGRPPLELENEGILYSLVNYINIYINNSNNKLSDIIKFICKLIICLNNDTIDNMISKNSENTKYIIYDGYTTTITHLMEENTPPYNFGDIITTIGLLVSDNFINNITHEINKTIEKYKLNIDSFINIINKINNKYNNTETYYTNDKLLLPSDDTLHTPIKTDGPESLLIRDLLIEQYKENNIHIEVNPLSNYMFADVPDISDHPGKLFINKGLSISINSDDACIFNYDSVNWDWLFIIVLWGLKPHHVKKICEDSINASFFTNKEYIKKLWSDKWNESNILINDNEWNIDKQQELMTNIKQKLKDFKYTFQDNYKNRYYNLLQQIYPQTDSKFNNIKDYHDYIFNKSDQNRWDNGDNINSKLQNYEEAILARKKLYDSAAPLNSTGPRTGPIINIFLNHIKLKVNRLFNSIQTTGNPYLKKYLKYKQKYLELSKSYCNKCYKINCNCKNTNLIGGFCNNCNKQNCSCKKCNKCNKINCNCKNTNLIGGFCNNCNKQNCDKKNCKNNNLIGEYCKKCNKQNCNC